MAGEKGESEINRMKGNVKKGNDVVCVCADLFADADHIISFPSHFRRFAKMTLMQTQKEKLMLRSAAQTGLQGQALLHTCAGTRTKR